MHAAAGRNSWGWPGALAVMLVGINIFDCIFTLVFLQLGLCSELNPFMRACYQVSPWVFAAVKLTLVNASVALLMRLATRPAARVALHAMAAMYVVLAAYELAHLGQLFH